MKKVGVWLAILVLVTIDQGIKVIINNNYLSHNVPIWEPWLYFRPMFNRDYSWFNSMLQLGIGRWLHTLLVVAVMVLICLIYHKLNKTAVTPVFIDTLFVFVFAGAACSLIDKIYWDGSLDYIFVNGFFTFDLKDVYLNTFNALLVLFLVIDYKGVRKTLFDGT